MQQPLVLSPLFFAFVIVSRIPLAASFDTNFVNSQTGCLHHRVKVILVSEIITFWLLFVWNNKLAKWINKKKEDMKKNHVLILYMAFFEAALLQCTVKFNIQTEIFILVYRSSTNGKKKSCKWLFSDITKVIINTQRFLYSFQHFPQPHAGPSSRPFSSILSSASLPHISFSAPFFAVARMGKGRLYASSRLDSGKERKPEGIKGSSEMIVETIYLRCIIWRITRENHGTKFCTYLFRVDRFV